MHSRVSLATVYSSAQCVLSVVGSVGVILLFAGIPQLIYSPVVSAGNLLTFIIGAVLIITMVVGNAFLNYKYRNLARETDRERANQGESGDGSATTTGNPEDKPPSYECVLTHDGLPPEYSSIVPQKPPRYEEVVKETCTICGPTDHVALPGTCEIPLQGTSQPLEEGNLIVKSQKNVVTLNKVDEEEDLENERSSQNERDDNHDVASVNLKTEGEEQNCVEEVNRTSSSEAQRCVASKAGKCARSQSSGESET